MSNAKRIETDHKTYIVWLKWKVLEWRLENVLFKTFLWWKLWDEEQKKKCSVRKSVASNAFYVHGMPKCLCVWIHITCPLVMLVMCNDNTLYSNNLILWLLKPKTKQKPNHNLNETSRKETGVKLQIITIVVTLARQAIEFVLYFVGKVFMRDRFHAIFHGYNQTSIWGLFIGFVYNDNIIGKAVYARPIVWVRVRPSQTATWFDSILLSALILWHCVSAYRSK